MKGNIGGLLKQAQQMQENLRKAQDELAKVEVTGSAGGGLVSITMTCRHDVKRVQIDPSLLVDDKEVLEDLIAAAMNDAVRKVEETSRERMAGLTAGLGLPGFNLPF